MLSADYELQENQVDMCWYGDGKYPDEIRALKSGNIPSVLFYKGNFHILDKKCVGFTGSRNVSDSGIRITEEPTAEGNKYFIERGGDPIRGDKNGKPILKRVYATLEKDKQVDDYEQLKLEVFGR